EPVIRTGPKAPFAIQVGAYTNPDEAHHMVSHWKQKGYPAYLASADIPGKGRWYRVRLGGFDSKKEAKSYLEKFRTQEGVDAFIAPSR
ncbi:MAG: SPOR domain-containing protein, partial [Deltaproteobacteria bacterium]|nr:SPOR domain-containing protein [Deltaproteobacteria bacterium]